MGQRNPELLSQLPVPREVFRRLFALGILYVLRLITRRSGWEGDLGTEGGMEGNMIKINCMMFSKN